MNHLLILLKFYHTHRSSISDKTLLGYERISFMNYKKNLLKTTSLSFNLKEYSLDIKYL